MAEADQSVLLANLTAQLLARNAREGDAFRDVFAALAAARASERRLAARCSAAESEAAALRSEREARAAGGRRSRLA